MADNITSITGGKRHPEPDYKPNQDVIDILSMTLEEAKKGHVHSVAVVGLRHDDSAIIAGRLSPAGNAFEMVGAIEFVKLDMANGIMDQIYQE